MKAELRAIEAERERRKRIEACREDINLFAEYVFDGLVQHEFHKKLQTIVNKHNMVCIDAPIEHGKTFQMSILRPLYLLGKNQYETIALISNTGDLPERCLDVITQQILHNPRVTEVFPALKLREKTKTQITVDRGSSTEKDPSILAIGVMGSIIGRRFSTIILDDVQDFSNTFSENERKKLWTVIESTILGRLVQTGSLIDIGTPWHVEDARSRLRKMKGFKHYRFNAMDMLWPEVYKDKVTGKEYGWPIERLRMKQKQMSALEFDRQFRCEPMSASMAIFSQDSFDKCKVPGLGKLGRPADNRSIVVSGVDVAISKKDVADETCIFTIAPYDGKKEILDIRRGRWELTEICRQIIDTVRRYPNHRGFRIETNAAQDFLRQALSNSTVMLAIGATEQDLQRINVIAHQTTKKKFDEKTGIRSMQVDFEQGRWIIPCSEDGILEEQLEAWREGLLNFDPLGHTDDAVMGSYLACEEARRYWTGGKNTWGKFGII